MGDMCYAVACVWVDFLCPNKLNVKSLVIKPLAAGLFELELLSPARVTIH